MEKIENVHKSDKLNRQKVVTTGTLWLAGIFLVANLIVPSMLAQTKETKVAVQTEENLDNEAIFLETLYRKLEMAIGKEEITVENLRENIVNAITTYKETNENISSEMDLVLMLIEMSLDNAIKNSLPLDEAISNVNVHINEGFDLKGVTHGKEIEEIKEGWGLTLTPKN